MKGIKYDNGKLRWDLLPFKIIEIIVKVITFGSVKYGEYNWKNVNNAEERYFAAALRHIVEYKKGNKLDSETGLPHLAHALCCLIFLLWFDEKKNKDTK